MENDFAIRTNKLAVASMLLGIVNVFCFILGFAIMFTLLPYQSVTILHFNVSSLAGIKMTVVSSLLLISCTTCILSIVFGIIGFVRSKNTRVCKNEAIIGMALGSFTAFFVILLILNEI